MKKLLESLGWYQYKQCTCGGVFKQKFKHPDKPSKEIWIYPNRNTWDYRVGRTRYGFGTGEQSLQKTLDTI